MFFRKLPSLLTLILALWSLNFAQTPSAAPRQEKLLNGLRVLMWTDAGSPKVSVKIRVHAGASFDPQDKEGVMKLLSESIFPNNDVREFFTDELGGDLVVTCNYDYIEIAASSRADAYLSLLETLANAITNPVFEKAVADAVKAKIAVTVDSNEKNAAYVADLAVRKRLFQTFPYGRPISGTSESLKKIDFADLRFAYDRLFGADNATIAISGNFPADTGYRAVRRYFGAWLKSDRKAPSTFRQPNPPIEGLQIVASPEPEMTEIRYAVRGVARSDKEYAAANVLARIYELRIRAKAPEDQRANVFVQNDSNILPGIMMFSFTRIRRQMTAEVSGDRPKVEANDVIATALSERVTSGEFEASRSAAVIEYDKVSVSTRWLDADTYKLTSLKADQQSFTSISIADIQTLADRVKQQLIASVILLPSKTGN